jgi:hypothetical protein
MDGMSLQQLVDVLDKNLVEVSPIVVAKRQAKHSTLESVVAKREVRNSTPDPPDVELKLVGKGIRTHGRTEAASGSCRTITGKKAAPASRVRKFH